MAGNYSGGIIESAETIFYNLNLTTPASRLLAVSTATTGVVKILYPNFLKGTDPSLDKKGLGIALLTGLVSATFI